jgi:hypothetical protein
MFTVNEVRFAQSYYNVASALTDAACKTSSAAIKIHHLKGKS